MNLVPVVLNAAVLRSALIVWIIICLEAQKPKLNMLFLLPANTSDAIANRTAPAIVVAIDSIQNLEILKEFEVHWSLRDSECSATSTAKVLYDIWSNGSETTRVIFGGYCENVCKLLATVSQSLNVPFLAIGCRTSRERNHKLFPSHLAVEPSRFFTIAGVIAIMEYFKWKTLLILATPDVPGVQLSSELKEVVEDRNWNATLMITTISTVPEGFFSLEADNEVLLILEEIKKQARIVYFGMDKIYAARILILAQRNGMYNGEYAFIGYDLTIVDAPSIHASDEEWKSARVGLISFMAKTSYEDLESSRFLELINEKGRDSNNLFDPIQIQELHSKDRHYVKYAGELYTSIFLYSYLLNNSITKRRNEGDANALENVVENGMLILANPNNVPSNRKMLNFDPVGRSITDWLIINSGKSDDETWIGKVIGEKASIEKTTMTWPGGHTKTPVDEPSCGWDGEYCLSTSDLILICTCPVIGVLAIAGVCAAIIFVRRMKMQVERRILKEWQVKWSQIIVIGDNLVGRISADATRSKTSVGAGSQVDRRSDHRSSHRSFGQIYTLAGIYKGKTVAIKKVNRDSVNIFQPAIFNEIKQLFYISHANVNPFMGICGEAPNVCVLMLYADRGSLQDVLAETKYDINWEFRICLATDVAKGMEYLHESPIGPHGHLTSSNCVVDSKWECRITDYGLKQFTRSKNQEIGIFRWNSDLLWTAPEILEKPETDKSRIYGTNQGDIYSFGIIVSEIITKEMPYHKQLESITPEDIIIKLKTDPKFRPSLPPPEDVLASSWNNLAIICWHRNQDVRPSFRSIRWKLKAISGGKAPHLMERMQRMMEDALQRKATDIAAEKQKTKTVVFNLLPQSIAEKISNGKEVRPQRISSVTLCLCEMRDLYESSKSLSPVEMTTMLKSLFRIYDDIMKNHNVIEISSRGSRDAMILSSGLPQYTEKHAEEICELSLELISEALTFKTPLAPDLNVSPKIAIHSGPVLTAVIWRTFPRYCVNGEAVDTVMAMRGASKAMRVQISEATYREIGKSGSFTVEEGEKVTLKDATAMRTYWLTGKTENRKPLRRSVKRKSSSLKTKKKIKSGKGK